MNESLWATSAKIIVPVDGIRFGFAVFHLLFTFSAGLPRTQHSPNCGSVENWHWKSGACLSNYNHDNSSSRCLFRSPSSACSRRLLILFSKSVMRTCQVFIFVDGNVANVLYGPVLDYLPERMIDILFVAFLTQAQTLWQVCTEKLLN